MPRRALTIGTRGSKLALAQARRVQAAMAGPAELFVVKTSGDRFQDKPLHAQGGIGLFTKEIEQALLDGRIDLAVHSLKDLPTTLAPGLELGAVLARDEAGDMLLAHPDAEDPSRPLRLRAEARVGASSLRRQALLGTLGPCLTPGPIRGNVPTRVDKVRRGEHDAIVLARAGLERLALDVAPLLAFDLDPDRWICAPGQGAIAVEIRTGDQEVIARVASLDDPETRVCTGAERSLLLAYGGGCHAPFGAHARLLSGDRARVGVAAPGADGEFRVRAFDAPGLDGAHDEAAAWIRAGCPAAGQPGPDSTISGHRHEQVSIVRPARPWR